MRWLVGLLVDCFGRFSVFDTSSAGERILAHAAEARYGGDRDAARTAMVQSMYNTVCTLVPRQFPTMRHHVHQKQHQQHHHQQRQQQQRQQDKETTPTFDDASENNNTVVTAAPPSRALQLL